MILNRRVLLFARYPRPGQVKTRLIPRLGEKTAAGLQRRMTESALSTVLSLQGVEAELLYTGAGRSRFRSWLGPGPEYREQTRGDLGNRLKEAFADSLNGERAVVAAGSDIPGIRTEHYIQAFQGLEENDIVIGPADDGGYYLIGMKELHPALFAGIKWGSPEVFQTTVQKARLQGLSYSLLPPLSDIDRPEDLDMALEDARFSDLLSGRVIVSVIIPVLNEARLIGEKIRRLKIVPDLEIIVVDGGSEDGSREMSLQGGARVLLETGGRAAQQNAGAEAAKGRVLLFLHADTELPEGFREMILSALDEPEVSAGAFGFKTDGRGIAIRLVEWGANIRSLLLRMPYGDQGLFMEKRVFREIGGFQDLPIMEDFQLVRSLRRRGSIVILPGKAVTSSRRWRERGIIRTFVTNQLMVAGFFLGISPAALAAFYRRSRKERRPVRSEQ